MLTNVPRFDSGVMRKIYDTCEVIKIFQLFYCAEMNETIFQYLMDCNAIAFDNEEDRRFPPR